jgi:hypothetical protein
MRTLLPSRTILGCERRVRDALTPKIREVLGTKVSVKSNVDL